MIRCLAVAAGMLAATSSAGLPPRPAGPVLDLTGTLGEFQRADLVGICLDLAATGKAVLVVAIVPTLEGDSIEGYAVRLFKAWGIGAKEKHNGVLLLVSTGDRKVRIETGYGVEAILPDGKCGEIIRRDIIPKFKSGDPAGGILVGASSIAASLGGEREGRGRTSSDEETGLLIVQIASLLLGPVLVIFGWKYRVAFPVFLGFPAILMSLCVPLLNPVVLRFVMLGAGCVLAAKLNPGKRVPLSLARWNRHGWMTGGWGSGSSGGGGFGGGSGGSFGGFGGGFSGGGGASGSW